MAEQALARGDAAVAVAHVEATLNPPGPLGETRQPLASPAQLSLAMGIAARHQLDFVLVADPGHELARDIINQPEAAGSPR